jgi:hypothetical protein
MFEHYTHEGRRVIYFAREAARHAASSEITSMHVLLGLLVHESSRADTLFRLRQLFPEETARQLGLQPFPAPKNTHHFCLCCGRGKKTQRLLDRRRSSGLGHPARTRVRGHSMLNQAGLQIDAARSIVKGHQASRKKHWYRARLWRRKAPIPPLGMQAGFLYLLGIVWLIKILTQRGCVLRFLR